MHPAVGIFFGAGLDPDQPVAQGGGNREVLRWGLIDFIAVGYPADRGQHGSGTACEDLGDFPGGHTVFPFVEGDVAFLDLQAEFFT